MGSCMTPLKKINITKDKTIESKIIPCKIPFNITADSLANLIQFETVKRFEGSYSFLAYDSFSIRKTLIAKKNIPKLDSALIICQNYLIDSLGYFVYCNYLFLTYNSINAYENGNSEICFGFSIPNLKSTTKSIWADSLNDEHTFCFYLPYHENGFLEIKYPTVPFCKSSEYCKFKISKQLAIDTLEKVNFLKRNDNFIIDLTDNFEWRIIKKVKSSEEEIKINIKTGQISDIIYSHKID